MIQNNINLSINYTWDDQVLMLKIVPVL